MEILDKGYWVTLIEDPTENPESVTGEDGATLPIGSGTDDPVEDPDFLEVSNLIIQNQNNEENILKEEEKEEVKESESRGSESVEGSDYDIADVISNMENLSIQLGVIDVVLVLSLLLSILKNFIRVPK